MEQITLPDNRLLSYEVYGDDQGVPVFYQHGWPACRLEAFLYEKAASAAGVALISVDRPGFGGSGFQPSRQLLDWPGDLCGVADQLGLDQFHILGHSGGGPYAAACGFRIPDRLLGTTIVAGLSPMTNRRTREGMRRMNQFLLSVGKSFPWVLDLMMRMTQKMGNDPGQLKKGFEDLPAVDRELITHFLPEVIDVLSEAFSEGTGGATLEGRIYASPWGFDLSEITVPVSIWQGSLDVNVPLSNGQIYAEDIPESALHVIEGEGHFSLPINKGEMILADLIGSRET